MKDLIKKLYLVIKKLVGLFVLNERVLKLCQRNLHTDLYKLSLRKYISITVEDNLKVLRFLPIPMPKSAYVIAFNTLQKQYAKLADNKTYAGHVTRQQEKNLIKSQIFFYSTALKLIHDFDNAEGSIDFFNKNGFTGTKDEIMQQVSDELMGLKSNLDDMEALDEANKKDEGGKDIKKVTREDYSRTILVANKNGYNITYKSSVADFIHTMSLQKEEIKNMNSDGK